MDSVVADLKEYVQAHEETKTITCGVEEKLVFLNMMTMHLSPECTKWLAQRADIDLIEADGEVSIAEETAPVMGNSVSITSISSGSVSGTSIVSSTSSVASDTSSVSGTSSVSASESSTSKSSPRSMSSTSISASSSTSSMENPERRASKADCRDARGCPPRQRQRSRRLRGQA